MDAETWLALAHGETNWDAAMQTGKINASGARSDLSEFLPLAPNRISS
jgi:putative sterol carrier protein